MTTSSTPQEALRVIPLGGLGDIGRNMMLYEIDNQAIAVDCGLMFPDDEHLGVDIIIPDFSYLREDPSRLQALFITHGHEDHIGAAAFLLREFPVPVFCTKLTRGLLQVKLRDHNLQDKVEVRVVEPGQTINIGPFGVEFFSVSHSIPDSAGMIIHTPHGPVVHTGDFKIDHTPVMGQHTDLTRLAEIGRDGALLLCADSTYAEVEGYTPSEQRVAERIDAAIGKADGRVIMTTFASLISRVQMVLDAAVKYDKRVFVTGRSMVNNVQMARDLGYLTAPDQVLMSIREMRDHPTNRTIVICTGSQGEPNAALTRIAQGSHQHVNIQDGDTVILSSNPVPGNEKSVSRNINLLFEAGANVIYNRIDDVHVRGHAAREELKIIHRIVRPKNFVPIHGEYRHLALHSQLAIQLGLEPAHTFVLEDGDVLEVTADDADIIDEVPSNYIYVDGLGVGDIDHIVLRDRAHLATDGMFVIVAAVDRHTQKLTGPPEVMSHGFIGLDDEDEIFEGARQIVLKMLGADEKSVNWRELHENLKDEIARYLYNQTHRRPLVLPVMLEV
ncbi:MAG: ribonuclease J [Dehalococcoidia bacterium]|nr:ribonuclease J [Dehalococcoidia bacterium]